MKLGVRLGEREVGRGRPAFLIAEAGINHNGDIGLALELIDAAADSGADAVKFQSFDAAGLMHPDHAAYSLIAGLTLDRDAHRRLAQRARERGVGFASTPFDPDWVETLCELGAVFLKIASPDILTVPLLERVGRAGRPVVLSTGLATLEEIQFGVETLVRSGLSKDQLILLHCVSAYPTPLEAANLGAIRTLEDHFEFPVGFSDHTIGIEAPVWAVAAGACMIEKHFTLDASMEGPDHALSLDPSGFKRMADTIRSVEKCVGTGEKNPMPEELAILNAARRGLMTLRPLKRGEQIQESDLRAVRPLPENDGVGADRFREIVGCCAARDFPDRHMLRRGDVVERGKS